MAEANKGLGATRPPDPFFRSVFLALLQGHQARTSFGISDTSVKRVLDEAEMVVKMVKEREK